MSAAIDVITLEDSAECAEKLLEAARSLGFVYITLEGTDITPAKVAEMFKIVSSSHGRAVHVAKRAPAKLDSRKASLILPSLRSKPARSPRTTKAGAACSRRRWIPVIIRNVAISNS